MKQQIPFRDLICTSCRSPADGERLPKLDYAIAEVPVRREDGTVIMVPIDIRECDVEYRSEGRFAARILARVPCPSCNDTHSVDVTSARKAPALELQRTPCPRCDNPACTVTAGPTLRYREKDVGDAWVEVSAEMICPNCSLAASATGNLDAWIFDGVDAVVPVQLQIRSTQP
jgi:hypothetical protein